LGSKPPLILIANCELLIANCFDDYVCY